MPPIDLHCHTTASDGMLTPTELVGIADVAGIDVIGVTDHDTVSGLAEAVRAGEAAGVRVVPGIELSTRFHERNVHVLGYFVDPEATDLAEAIGWLRADRIERAQRIVERLGELGFPLTMDDVLTQAGDSDVIVRPHIARALVAKGYVPTVRDAFTPELLADGGRADVPKLAIGSVEAVELIRAGGGAAVIAHPCVGHHEGDEGPVPRKLIEALREVGLAGIEVDHPDHGDDVRSELVRLAGELGLVGTGGSDYHGEHGTALGTCTTSPESLAALEATAGG